MEETIRVRCGHCRTPLDAPKSKLGQSIQCPDCHSPVLVKAAAADAPGQASRRDKDATERAHRDMGGTVDSFGFPCSLCGTRLYAEARQQGTEVTCPDCHSHVKVPAPPVRTAPVPTTTGGAAVAPPDDDEDFQLEDVAERPRYRPTDRGKVSSADMEALQRSNVPVPSATQPPAAATAGPTAAADPAERKKPERKKPEQPAAPQPTAPPTSGTATEKKSGPKRDGVTLSAVCPHCHSRLGFRDDQIGKRVRCGDCHGEFVVKPQVKKPPPTQPPPPSDDDEFQLSEVFERPVVDPMAHDSLAKAERAAAESQADLSGKASGDGGKASAETGRQPVDPLATAGREHDEDQEQRTTIGDLKYFPRMLGFLVQGEAIARLALLSIMSGGMLWLISGGTQAAAADGMAQAMTVIFIIFGLMIFVPLALGTMANCFAITADTASGAEYVENWPEDIFTEWIGASITMFVITMVSGLPAALVTITLRSFVGQYALLALVPGLWFCYPIVLLSVMEGDGLGSMISPPIIRSLAIARKHWLRFYAETIILLALMSPALMFTNHSNFWVLLAISVWNMLFIFIYFRAIGVLGFYVAIALNEHDSNIVVVEPDDDGT